MITAIVAAIAIFPAGAAPPASSTLGGGAEKSLDQPLYDHEHGTADPIAFDAQLQTVAPESATRSLMLAAGFLLAGSMFRRRKTR